MGMEQVDNNGEIMRNNTERIRKQDSESNNPLLDFVKPSHFVELPSKGKSYPEGHALRNKDVIEVYQMTAKDEDILTSQSLLKKGVAIDRFVENILVDKSIDLRTLLVCDKNAILLESRILGYGPDYSVDITCPNCYTVGKRDYDISEKTIHYGIEDEISQEGLIKYKLPRSGVEVELKLLTSREESEIISSVLNGNERKNVEQQLKLLIHSANGITDKEQISQFIEAMPIIDSLSLRNHYKKVSPNVELKYNFTCNSCGHQQELEVPLSADFFWPKL